MKLLKYENAKLKQQHIFTLPASQEVCGRVCPGCYAIKPQIRFPKTVLPYRERMLESSKTDSFVSLVVQELSSSKRPSKTVRVHESGEFYSQEYVDKWKSIASQLPDFIFYAFTKRLKHFDFSGLKSLPNFVVIDSLHGGKLNYNTLEKLDPSRPICPVTLGQDLLCGITCRICMDKSTETTSIQFVKH